MSAAQGRDPARWWLLGGVWMIYACFGLVVASMAPLVPIIVEDLHLSLSAMGSILGAWPLVYILTAIPAGTFIDRVGLKLALFIAALVIACSGLLRGLAGGHASLFLAVAVFGIGGPLVSVGAPKLIAQYFSGVDRGTAMGIYLTGPSVGSLAALSLTHSVVMPAVGDSWRAVMLCYAAVGFAGAALWLAIAQFALKPQAQDDAHPRAPESSRSVVSQLARLPVLHASMCMGLCMFFFNQGLNSWVPAILRASGMSLVHAGYWATIPVVVGIVASLVIPRRTPPELRFRVLLVLFVCGAGATLCLHSTQPWLLGSGLVLQGISRSVMMPLVMLVMMESRAIDPRHMGTAGGMFFSASEIGGVLGPLVSGFAADVTGGFDATLWVLASICVVMALLLGWLRRAAATAPLPAAA
ncbi:MAG: CynX/NimT family MFS transporter [Gammaproteobacteria bacterium]